MMKMMLDGDHDDNNHENKNSNNNNHENKDNNNNNKMNIILEIVLIINLKAKIPNVVFLHQYNHSSTHLFLRTIISSPIAQR